ncbi:MAG: hypothetical protein KDB68_01440 [Planctomycetes bacterium]|nr:hypothetical protein [Planctomycetota bacterium]MCA8934843.1 hypothetical protein [Planctomycetota bacterium]MCA8946406.1 hypothetical protein [Planctomycetota bacterium]
MRRCIALALLAPLLCLFWQGEAQAETAKTVNCVYPGEVLASALADFSTQLGYRFEPGDYEDSFEIEQPIWVLAKDVKPELAARMIGASGGVQINLDDANRRITLTDLDSDEADARSVKGFKIDDLAAHFLAYQKRYGRVGDGTDPDLLYRPTATEELRDAISEILRLEETEGGAGSAVGKRLIYTRSKTELAQISELIQLLGTAAGGESAALKLDRRNRDELRKLRSDFQPGDGLLSALLYQLFKDYSVPVYIDAGLMGQFDFQYDTTEVTLEATSTHFDALQALARENFFAVDSVGGALRLNQQDYAGSASYRVFDVSELLVELEQAYTELKTGEDVLEGFHGDLRSHGGVDVVIDALELQLESAGHSPLIRAYGALVVVVGGVDVVDAGVEVLEAMGWKQAEANEEPK